MSDYIKLDKPEKEDRVIRQLYTPKEIVGTIQKTFNEYNSWRKLTNGDTLLLAEFCNWLIWGFKDD